MLRTVLFNVIQEHQYLVLECHETSQCDSEVYVPDPLALRPELPSSFKQDSFLIQPPAVYLNSLEARNKKRKTTVHDHHTECVVANVASYCSYKYSFLLYKHTVILK